MSYHSDKYDVFMKMLEIIEQEQSVHLSALSNDQKQKARIVIERFRGTLIQEQTLIDNIEGDKVVGAKKVDENKVEVLLGDNARIYGDFVVANSIQNSFNKITSSDMSNELKEMLKELVIAVGKMSEELPKEDANEVAEDLDALVNQATREKPKRKWWSVSIEGLTKAAENIGKVGKPVLDLIGKILPILEKISV